MTAVNNQLDLPSKVIACYISGVLRAFLTADFVKGAHLNELCYPGELFRSVPGTDSFPDYKHCLKGGIMVLLLQTLQLKMPLFMKHDTLIK